MIARTLILAAAASAALSSAALAQGYGFGGPAAMHRGYGGGGWGGGYGPGSTNRLGPGFGPGGTLHRIDGGRGGTIVGPTTPLQGYRPPQRPEPIYMPGRPGQGYD